MKRLISFCILVCVFIIFAKGGFAMEITSPAFKNKTSIPEKFTCQGDDFSPPLAIKDVPSDTQSLVLIVNDPDASSGSWDHWLVYNISPQAKVINENTVPGIQCVNDSGVKEWGGPCPPSGAHRYFFKIYALDIMLPALSERAGKDDLLRAMEGHILDTAELMGLYKKSF